MTDVIRPMTAEAFFLLPETNQIDEAFAFAALGLSAPAGALLAG